MFSIKQQKPLSKALSVSGNKEIVFSLKVYLNINPSKKHGKTHTPE